MQICTNNPYTAFEDAFIRAVRKGLAKAVPEIEPELRPWIDERPTAMAAGGNRFSITEEDIQRAVAYLQEPIARREIAAFQYGGYYIFMTEWVAPFVSEEDCILHYADDGSVIVVDGKRKMWHRGRQIEMAGLLEVKRDLTREDIVHLCEKYDR